MASIEKAVLDLKRLDLLANNDSSIHRLDARAKVLATGVFILCVVSYDRYELAALLPFVIFPAILIALADLPALFIAKKIALLCPFVLMVGIFNPVFDREVLVNLGPLAISGGWISFVSILIRSILTVGAAFILVGVTGFTAVCQALDLFAVVDIPDRRAAVLVDHDERAAAVGEGAGDGAGVTLFQQRDERSVFDRPDARGHAADCARQLRARRARARYPHPGRACPGRGPRRLGRR